MIAIVAVILPVCILLTDGFGQPNGTAGNTIAGHTSNEVIDIQIKKCLNLETSASVFVSYLLR